MIKDNMEIDLLRRLTIIPFEDELPNKYYPTLVWYYVVLANNKEFNLTYSDIRFIYSYVGLLCNIDKIYIPKDDSGSDSNIQDNSIYNISLDVIKNNVNRLSLYLRIQYGVFKGEINLMNRYIYDIINKNIDINRDELSLEFIDTDLLNEKTKIVKAAIDFHCFPKMIEKVYSRIDESDLEKYNITEQIIKDFIWRFESNINYRINSTFTEEEKEIWKNIVKPKCDVYRVYIIKMIS